MTKEYKAFYKKAGMADGHRNDCIECNLALKKEQYKHDRQSYLIRARKRYIAKSEEIKAHNKQWYANTTEDRRAVRIEYYKNNKKLFLHLSKLRKRHIKQATPIWADLNEIKKIYANCPDGFHVDHIIPLRSKNVSGLHVPLNLQYLSATENLSKGNKF